MTVYLVQAPGTDFAGLAKTRFVKEGFSKPAFIFAQLWLLYHRLWLALLVWIVLEVAFFVLVQPHVTLGVTAAIDLLARLYLGFEGNRLRLKRDAAIDDVVEARDLDEAEEIFFRRHIVEPVIEGDQPSPIQA